MDFNLTRLAQDGMLAWRYSWITPEIVPELVFQVRLSGGRPPRWAATRFLFVGRNYLLAIEFDYSFFISVARFFTYVIVQCFPS